MAGAAQVGALTVTVSADTGQFTAAMTEASRTADSSAKSIINSSQGITDASKTMTAAGRRLVDQLKEEITTFGMTKEQLMQYRANLLGVGDQVAQLQARLAQMKSAQTAFAAEVKNSGSALSSVADGLSKHGAAANDAGKHVEQFSLATAGARRELIVLAHELSQGNYSRFSGSLLVLAERTNAASLLFSAAGAAALGMAAAIGSVAAAIAIGIHESEKLNEQLKLTGDYAGITASQFNAMAASIAAQTQTTIGKSRDMLEGVVASGKVSGTALTAVTQAAVKFANDTGASTDDVLKDFLKMTDGVTKWADKHNEQYHFLTASQYEYIRNLEKEGDTEQAMEEVSKALYNHLGGDAVNDLGSLEKAWVGVKNVMAGVWDYLKGIGREEDNVTKIKELQATLAMPKRSAGDYSMSTGPSQSRVQMQAELDARVFSEYTAQEAATANAASAQLQEAGIKASNILEKLHKQYMTRAQEEAQAVKEYKDAIAARIAAGQGGIDSETQQQAMLKAIHDRYKESTHEKISDYQKLTKAIQEKLSAGQLELDSESQLTEGEKYAAKVMADISDRKIQLTQVQAAYIAKLLEEIIAQDRANEAKQNAVKWGNALLAAGDKELKSLDSEISKQQDYAEQIGLTKDQVDSLQAKKLALSAASDEEMASNLRAAADYAGPLHDAYIQYAKDLDDAAKKKRQLVELKEDAASRQAMFDAAKKAEEAWKESEKSIEDGLYHAIGRGGGGAFKKLMQDVKSWFARLVLSPVIKPIAQFGASIISPMAQSAIGNIGSSLGMSLGSNALGLGGGSGLFGMFGTSSASALASGTLSAADIAGGMIPEFGTDAAMASGMAGGGLAGAGSGLMSVLGAIPGWGWVLAGVAALAGLSKQFKGETRSGGQYAYQFGNNPFTDYQNGQVSSGTIRAGKQIIFSGDLAKQIPGGDIAAYLAANPDFTYTPNQAGVNQINGPSGGEIAHDTVAQAITGTVQGINDLLKQIGSAATLTGFQAGLESSGKGRGGVFAGGTLSTGATFGLSGKGNNYNGTLYDTAFSTSPDSATALTNFATDLKQTTLQALQAATDIPKSISSQLQGLNIKSMTDQQVTDFLTSITTEITGVNQLRDALNAMPLANLKNLSFDAADALNKLAGGAQVLTGELNSYYQNFYTQDERIKAESEQVQKTLSGLGYTGVTTNTQFRQLVESLDVTTDSGQKAFASLMSIQQAFADVAGTADKTTQATITAIQGTSTAQQTVDSARQALTDAYKNEADALNGTISKFTQFSQSIRDFRDSLLTGSLSNLSPEQKYLQLKGQFDKTYSMSLAGDPTAMGNLQGIAQQFLEASQGYYASSQGYSDDLDKVRAALGNAANAADSQAGIAQTQLAALNQQVSGLITINQSVLSVKDAITALNAALTGTTSAPSSSPVGAVSSGGASQQLSAISGYAAKNGSSYYIIPGVNDFAAKLQAAKMSQASSAKVGDVRTVEGTFKALFGMSEDAWKGIESQFNAGIPVQARALGGYTPPGITLVGETGPELVNFTRPSQIYTASQTRSILGSGDPEVKQVLRDILSELRSDKTQRAAVGTATIDKLEKVVNGLDANKRQLARA